MSGPSEERSELPAALRLSRSDGPVGISAEKARREGRAPTSMFSLLSTELIERSKSDEVGVGGKDPIEFEGESGINFWRKTDGVLGGLDPTAFEAELGMVGVLAEPDPSESVAELGSSFSGNMDGVLAAIDPGAFNV